MKKLSVFAMMLFLTACDFGPPTLDMKNADTFLTSLDEITVEMTEQDRIEFAAAILTVFQDKKRNGKATLRNLNRLDRDAAIFFIDESQSLLGVSRGKAASEIVLEVGAELDGKGVEEITELSLPIYAAAVERDKEDRRKRLTKQLADYEARLKKSEQRLEKAQADLTSETERQSVAREILASLKVTSTTSDMTKDPKGQLTPYLSYEIQLENGTGEAIKQLMGKFTLQDRAGRVVTTNNFSFLTKDFAPDAVETLGNKRVPWKMQKPAGEAYVFSEEAADYVASSVVERLVFEDGRNIAVSDGWRAPDDIIENMTKSLQHAKDDRDKWLSWKADTEKELKSLQ